MSSARDHEPNEASGGDAIPLLEETAGDERVAPYTPSSKGRLRAYWLGCVVCMGGFLCGYDSGMLVFVILRARLAVHGLTTRIVQRWGRLDFGVLSQRLRLR